MRKFNIMILSLVQMFFAHSAYACIEQNPAWYTIIIPFTLCLLAIWLGFFAIYSGICALVDRIIKKFKMQHLCLAPVLIYAIGAGSLFFCVAGRAKPDWCYNLCYIGYVGYIIFCCGYQLRAHIKQQKPKGWTWICPIVPFYANTAQIILWYLFKRTYIIIRLVLFIAFIIGFSYGLYKLDLQKSPKYTIVQKVVWGLLLSICCVLGSYILYTDYAYEDVHKIFYDCM